jgi:Ni,Fe-hydrogenase I large subunit
MATKTIAFSPFTRVEGDLQVSVDVEDGHVARSFASGTLFRGFEAMLRGRDPMDALVITCRVCGQCGLTHSAASAAAIRALSGALMPRNAFIASNVMLAVEAILSHLTHFYLSFAPELSQLPGGPAEAQRFEPPGGRSFSRALREREEILGVLGLFAGKWPNSLAIQPGGTTRPVDASEIRRAHGLLEEYVKFVEQQLIGDGLDEWLAIRGADDLDAWMEEGPHRASDLGVFFVSSVENGLDSVGTWNARFISSGGWPDPEGVALMAPGFHDGKPGPLDQAQIGEQTAWSWYENTGLAAAPHDQRGSSLHPFDGETVPDPTRTEAYSWAKAPRYAGQPAEAGPLARLANDGDPLVVDLMRRHGPSAFVREMARLHETMRLLKRLNAWLDEVDPEEPFFKALPPAMSGSGVGLVEAPRGMLGHWLRVEDGKIRNYQIITPTGWNLSPRDSKDQPGPLEEALIGAPVADGHRPVALSYVVKSFDPCLYCTVH